MVQEKSDKPPEIEIDGEAIEVLQLNKPFTYLGKPLTVAGELQSQPNDLLQKYKELLSNIENRLSPIALKIEALECIAMANIQHHFANTYINDETINEFDKALTSFLRRIFALNHSTTVRSMFLKKHVGGIGIRKPSIVYRTTRFCYLFKMLNHQDENLRFIARNSLEIDFNKRGIKRSTARNNFLGYACKANGDLETNIQGGFDLISDWSHLHYIAVKLGLRLTWEHPENQNL